MLSSVVWIDTIPQLEISVTAKSEHKILSFQLLKLMNKEINVIFFPWEISWRIISAYDKSYFF